MTGATNLGLMRLVFSAIFHMQSASRKAAMNIEGGEAEEDEHDESGEEGGELAVSKSRKALPPISAEGGSPLLHSTSLRKSASVRRSSLPPLDRVDTDPEKKDKDKEKDLITLVLNGFENHNRVSYLTKAYQRFVPHDFLNYLGKENIEQVDIGDSMMTTITTMFIEIQGFHPLKKSVSERTISKLQSIKRYESGERPPPFLPNTSSRKLTHVLSKNTANMRADLFSFQFFNTINQKLLPIIRQCDGYVDKFFGNAILALFPNLDSATRAGLQILSAVKDFQNDEKEERSPAYAHLG